MKSNEEEIPEGHPSQETRIMFPEDIKLREHGFKIAHRRNNEQPMWERAKIEYTHSDALFLIGEKPDDEKESDEQAA
jgi:hypothetical protein